MKKYLAVFIGTEASLAKWKALDEPTRQSREKQGMTEWGNWVTRNSKAITEMGAPLGKTKLINSNGVSDTKNQLTAYTVVQAESQEAAANLFLNHPHFAHFPGDSIEVMECMPIPSM
jgi:hypothetical protein